MEIRNIIFYLNQFYKYIPINSPQYVALKEALKILEKNLNGDSDE